VRAEFHAGRDRAGRPGIRVGEESDLAYLIISEKMLPENSARPGPVGCSARA
jgi:hypothetical protein